jgi:hypothetical protein
VRPAITCGLAALAAAGAAIGCGGSNAPPAKGPPAAAAAVIGRLEAAIRARDWKLICEDLYSDTVRAQAGGDGCPKLLGRVAGGLRAASIEIDSITVGGRAARVEVVTRAQGQAPVPETIRLARDREGHFRIAGLGG